jgi:acetyltransferase-like isoleucine patch superfamily enzyme
MSLGRIPEDLLILGAHCVIDPTAVVGEQPSRPVADLRLRIGDGAQIRSGCVIYGGSTIGQNFRSGHYSIVREENTIGSDVALWGHSTIDYGCRIGDRVKIHTGVYVAQFTTIEDDVFIAPGVIIANDPHPGCPRARECMRGPTIRRGAQIGVNVTIVPFVEIGAGALVGAGSVVTRNVPAGTLVQGNPARVVKRVEDLTCVVQPPLVDRPSPASTLSDPHTLREKE